MFQKSHRIVVMQESANLLIIEKKNTKDGSKAILTIL